MTMQEGPGTADPQAGAADSQPSEAEVTKLRTDLETALALVTERDTELETANKLVSELQGANAKFASDAAGLAPQAQQLKDAQQALEESRKTSTDLTTQLEASKVLNTDLSGQATLRRRQDLMTRYGLPEERVAELDDAGLTVLETTLPHVPQATKPTTTAPTGNGLGMGGGTGVTPVSDMSDSERATRMIERLKAAK